MSQPNAVDHPPHYTAGAIECIDALEAAAEAHHGDGFLAHLTLTAIKYLWRWPAKNGLEDLKKARWYIDRAIATIERQVNSAPTRTELGVVHSTTLPLPTKARRRK